MKKMKYMVPCVILLACTALGADGKDGSCVCQFGPGEKL